MSDQSTAMSGGLLRGADGKISGRKLLGLLGFVAGVALGVLALLRGASVGVLAVALGVPMAFSGLMYGILTAQNLREIAQAAKP